jgi:ABC-2 type transport system ATP-binding protein
MVAESVIEVIDLVKRYNKMAAVDGISFKIKKGEVFAFLGPNGAGNTTTVEIIEGIRKATSGKVVMFGKDITLNTSGAKDRIGVLPQEFSSFDKLTVSETVRFYASLYRRSERTEDLIDLLNVKDHSKKLYQNLSGGLKQRVGIAVALVNDPEIIFLDEPTTGLDPSSRQEVWKVIKGLRMKGKTVFLTTHYMEEAQELADHVAIINKGKIIAEGTVDDLIDRYGKGIVITFHGVDKAMGDFLKECGEVGMEDDEVSLIVKDRNTVLAVLELVKGAGVGYSGLDVRRSNLEEVFLTLTGESLKQEAGK